MSIDVERATEHSHLLPNGHNEARRQTGDAQSILSSHVSKAEQALSAQPIGERLPYNDYSTIDWLHDLVRGEGTSLELLA